jgi:hypothetical protein
VRPCGYVYVWVRRRARQRMRAIVKWVGKAKADKLWTRGAPALASVWCGETTRMVYCIPSFLPLLLLAVDSESLTPVTKSSFISALRPCIHAFNAQQHMNATIEPCCLELALLMIHVCALSRALSIDPCAPLMLDANGGDFVCPRAPTPYHSRSCWGSSSSHCSFTE